MKRWRSALLVGFGLLVATAACSLAYRPSDYFDPKDQVTLVGTTSDNATSIVLTSSLVVYATSTGIYAVPKSGGDPQTVTTFASGALTALASNATDLVAWCGVMGVQAWRPGGAVVNVDPSTDCDSIDAHADIIAAAVTSALADASTFRIVVYRGPSWVVDPEAGAGLPAVNDHASNDRVSLTDGGLYYASGEVIGRKLHPGDRLLAADPLCILGAAGGTAHDFRAVELSGDGGLVTLYRGNDGFRFGTNDRCCKLDAGLASDTLCPKSQLDVNTSYRAIVIHEPYVYYLPDNELRRAALGAGDDASTLVRSGIGEVLGSLAVDDDFAYLGVADRVLKVALPR